MTRSIVKVDLINQLRTAAGRDNVTDAPDERYVYGYDASGLSHSPAAVVRAVDSQQISAVLRWCSSHRIPLVARGAGSGLSGGAVPVAGGVVLDMAGMNRILRIDVADQIAVTEPGVVTARLQAAAAKKGLFYPPDPASVDFCTIGGNVAENAGGLRAVKYGVTRDYVMGLKAVLPDGSVFETGGTTIKSVVGYDLTRLLVGSEGTLAVIVEITLRLLPLPEAKATVSGLFANVASATSAIQRILTGGIRPTALEFIDATCLRAVENHARLGIAPSAAAMLLIDIDGPSEVVTRQARQLADTLGSAGGFQVRTAQNTAEAEQLWRARRVLNPALRNLARGKHNEDVVIPLGRLSEMMLRIGQVARRRDLTIATFGHAGDGNLHVNVMYDPDNPRQEENSRLAVDDIFRDTLNLDGSLSGEHGVGLTKLDYVSGEIDAVALRLMQQIKKIFDPQGILNPHKAVPGA